MAPGTARSGARGGRTPSNTGRAVVEEVKGAAELLRVEEDKGEVEAAVVALEAPHMQVIDVQPAATLVRRQTEVHLMAFSLFCYVTIVRKFYRRKWAALGYTRHHPASAVV